MNDLKTIFKETSADFCQEIRKFVDSNESAIKISWLLKDIYETHNTNVVYFLRGNHNGLVKIGKSKCISKRIKELQGCFYQIGLKPSRFDCIALIYLPYGKDYSLIEKLFHEKFKSKCRIGEWFELSNREIYKAISSIYGNPIKINGVNVYCGIPDYTFIDMPLIIESSDDRYTNFIADIAEDANRIHYPYVRRKYGYSIDKILQAIEKYGNKRLDDVTIEILTPMISTIFEKAKLEVD